MTRASEDKTLVLVRHAKAEQVVGAPDHDRTLTARGRRDAVATGEWLKAQGIVPELVICSTSVRTRETWGGIAAGGCSSEFVEFRRAVYQGGTDGVLDSVREDAGEVDTVVVIGHGPSIPDLAGSLCDGTGSARAHQALAEGYPTCGVAILTYAGDWAELDLGTASLERFHVCRGSA